MTKNSQIWVVFGTRPEAIKQFPLYTALKDRFGGDRVKLVAIGQHKELLNQMIECFKMEIDLRITLAPKDSSLASLSSEVIARVGEALTKHKPYYVIVQGDTTSAAMTALAAFQLGIKVLHNEAGLRSFDNAHPFPEEVNRRLISVVSHLHFAPTEKAKTVLISEKVNEDSIFVCGNPGIDSMFWAGKQDLPKSSHNLITEIENKKGNLVLVTAHRRENTGEAFDRWFKSLAEFTKSHSDLTLLCLLHPNKLARESIEKYLRPLDRVLIHDPVDYISMSHLLKRSFFLVTDSGGLQEEAATLGIPCVISRKTTERSEGIDFDICKLAGTDEVGIISGMNWAYKRANELRPKTWPHRPFGDGNSGERITQIIAKFLPE